MVAAKLRNFIENLFDEMIYLEFQTKSPVLVMHQEGNWCNFGTAIQEIANNNLYFSFFIFKYIST